MNAAPAAARTQAVLDHARHYARAGLAVLPVHRPFERGNSFVCSCGRTDCSSPAKHPVAKLAPQGLKDATVDPETVSRWFADRSWNVGIATGAVSGIVVLDIDPRHQGDETLAALERVHGPLPPTWRFLTGGGGEHVIFRHPGGIVANSAGKVGPGIDVRADGGFIVAPPSMHVSGRPYAISVDHHPDETPLADLPAWLLAALRPTAQGARRQPASATEWRGRVANTVPEGERNVALARLAGLLLGRRVDPHVCLDLLLAFNITRCTPPLSESEVVATLASIARREYGGRRARRKGGAAGG